MNSRLQTVITIWSIIVATITIVAIPVFLYALGRFTISALKELDTQVATTTIATVGTAITALVTITLNQRWSKRKDIAESHRPQKVQAYKKFVAVITKVMKNSKKNKDYLKDSEDLPEDLFEEFFDFQEEFISWASPEVIRAFIKFRSTYNDPAGIVATIDEILRLIRKDLGHKDRGLKNGQLIGIFMANPSEVETMINSTNRPISRASGSTPS